MHRENVWVREHAPGASCTLPMSPLRHTVSTLSSSRERSVFTTLAPALGSERTEAGFETATTIGAARGDKDAGAGSASTTTAVAIGEVSSSATTTATASTTTASAFTICDPDACSPSQKRAPCSLHGAHPDWEACDCRRCAYKPTLASHVRSEGACRTLVGID